MKLSLTNSSEKIKKRRNEKKKAISLHVCLLLRRKILIMTCKLQENILNKKQSSLEKFNTQFKHNFSILPLRLYPLPHSFVRLHSMHASKFMDWTPYIMQSTILYLCCHKDSNSSYENTIQLDRCHSKALNRYIRINTI